jgi:hypothetical protein
MKKFKENNKSHLLLLLIIKRIKNYNLIHLIVFKLKMNKFNFYKRIMIVK